MSGQATDDANAPTDRDDSRFSRDPGNYAPTDHFVTCSRRSYGPISETRTAPPITAEVIATCIKHGEVRPATGNRVEFIANVAGNEWRLVVQPKDVGPDLVLTALSDAHNLHQIDDRVINSSGEVLPE